MLKLLESMQRELKAKNRIERTYDFLNPKGRRKKRGSTIKPQYEELDEEKRREAIVTARDLYNNVTEVYWAVNRYVKAVTGFVFQPTTRDRKLAARLTDFYEQFNATADITGRYTYEQLLRLWELREILDGDVLKVRLASGQFETIHGDWIRNCQYDGNWVNGVKVNEYGAPLAYSVLRQTSDGKEIKRIIDAKNAYLKFHSDGRIDSYRGVSPLISAFAEFQDCKEIKTYTNTKVKLESILALAIKRHFGKYDYGFMAGDYSLGSTGVAITDDVMGEESTGSNSIQSGTTLADSGNAGDIELNREFDLGEADEGATIIDLINDESITPVTPQTPSSSFQGFYDMSVKTGYKALDIPGSFADESISNYNSMRCASMQFEDSTEDEVEKNHNEIMNDILFAMNIAWVNGNLELPEGVSPSKKLFKLIHKRRRVIDADREFKSYGIGVTNGFWSFEDTCNMLGKDAYEIIDSNARVLEYAKAKGVSLPCIQPFGTEIDNDKSDAK